jgi:hypothetical protein
MMGRFAVIVVGRSVLVSAFEAGLLSLHPIANPQSTRTDADNTFFNMKRFLKFEIHTVTGQIARSFMFTHNRRRRQLPAPVQANKKTDIAEHPQVINYIGILVN